jgi:hypothetical protein
MGPYRSRNTSHDDRKRAAWKHFERCVLAHRVVLALFAGAVLGRWLAAEHTPRLSILLLFAVSLWTRGRARSAVCPVCNEPVLSRYSGLRALCGLFPRECLACSAAVGSLDERVIERKEAPTYLERSRARWQRFRRQALFTALGVSALYGIDRTGETVNVRGTMSRATTTTIPLDAHDGRGSTSEPVSRVYTEVGAFDWPGGSAGPVRARVTIGRLTGFPYPVSVSRAP